MNRMCKTKTLWSGPDAFIDQLDINIVHILFKMYIGIPKYAILICIVDMYNYYFKKNFSSSYKSQSMSEMCNVLE